MPPQDAPADADALALDSKVEAWIDAFHRLKKWERAPVNLRGAGKLMKTPVKRFREDLAKARETVGADAVERRIADAEAKRDTLQAALATTDDEDARARIEEEIAGIGQQIAQARTEIDLAIRIEQRVQRLEDAEGNLGAEKRAVMAEIADLQASVAAAAGDDGAAALPDRLDDARVGDFRKRHVEMQRRVDNARAEIMTFKKEGPDGPEERKYAVVNNTEYKILMGMLEKSILQLQRGDLDPAFATLDEVEALLVTYRNARTGADPIAQGRVLPSELGASFEVARSRIAELDKRGFKPAVQGLVDGFDDLKRLVDQRLDDGAAEFSAEAQAARTLAEDSGAAMQVALQIEGLFDATRADIATMRGNGHVHRPRRAEQKVVDYDPGDSMDAALATARQVRDYAAEKLADTRAEDLKRANMSDADLRAELDRLNARFAKLVKTRSDGTVKTKTDDDTGQQNVVPESGKLPAGAAGEMQLQLQAAEQLIASGSIDALKMAAAHFEGVDNFIGAIEQDPAIYRTFAKRFDALDARLKKIRKSFDLYEPDGRLELEARVKDLRDGHLTRKQADIEEDIETLDAAITAYRARVVELRGRKRGLKKTADERGEVLKDIGKLLANRKVAKGDTNPFDGYHGSYEKKLKAAYDKIAARSGKSLDDAAQMLVDMGDLHSLRAMMQQQERGEKLPPIQMDRVFEFVADARSGQEDHDKNQAQKKPFEAESKAVNKAVAKAIKATGKLKGDVSELEALENERAALDGETKESGDYVDGLARMTALNTRAGRFEKDAAAAAEILDTELDKAARACADSVREFRDHVAAFVPRVVAPAGELEGGGTQLDDPALYDRARIEGVMKSIADAMPDTMIAGLMAGVTGMMNKNAGHDARADARKEALMAVRALMKAFDGLESLAVFRTHPFKDNSIGVLEGARKALPRLEVRILRASV